MRTLRWASVVPAVLAESLGPLPGVRAIPIVEPSIEHTIGLVALRRDPATPMVTALVAVAERLARQVAEAPRGAPVSLAPEPV